MQARMHAPCRQHACTHARTHARAHACMHEAPRTHRLATRSRSDVMRTSSLRLAPLARRSGTCARPRTHALKSERSHNAPCGCSMPAACIAMQASAHIALTRGRLSFQHQLLTSLAQLASRHASSALTARTALRMLASPVNCRGQQRIKQEVCLGLRHALCSSCPTRRASARRVHACEHDLTRAPVTPFGIILIRIAAKLLAINSLSTWAISPCIHSSTSKSVAGVMGVACTHLRLVERVTAVALAGSHPGIRMLWPIIMPTHMSEYSV